MRGGRGGYHRQLNPTEGEIGVYHISLPAVLADALAEKPAPASRRPHRRQFKLVYGFDGQPNGPFTAISSNAVLTFGFAKLQRGVK